MREALIREMLKAEPDARRYLPAFLRIVDPTVGIVRYFGFEENPYGDEPDFLTCRAELTPTTGLSDGGYERSPAEGGRSQERDTAMVGAIFEAMERYSLSIYRQKDLLFTSFAELKDSGEEALDPCRLVSVEKLERAGAAEEFRRAVMGWIKGWSWKSEQEIWVPAQTVYLPYVFAEGETELRDPLTTGAAAGLTKGKAVLRGLMEVIERDATTIIHYRSLPCKKVDPGSLPDPALQKMIRSLERYELTCHLYEYSLDLPIPIIACKIMDKTGVGPTVTVGSKASFDRCDAARGALLEAACFRSPMRERMKYARECALPLLKDYTKVVSGEQRAYLWIQPEMAEHLDYLDGSEAEGLQGDERDGLTESGVRALIDQVVEQGDDLIVVDVATPDIRDLGVKVVKVIVPGLQPMHLSEPDRCWTARLLAYRGKEGRPVSVEELNPVPHPFL